LVDAQNRASGKVSGGGPPPHFNKPGDNLPQVKATAEEIESFVAGRVATYK
jgi:hypothetical protein